MIAVFGVVAFAQAPASAELKLPELPLPTATPLELEDLLNLEELLGTPLPVTTDLGQVVDGTTDTVSNLLGNTTDQPVLGGKTKPPATSKPAPETVTDSWATDGRLTPPASGVLLPDARVASHKIGPSYTSAIGNGFSRAARRAAELAGPVAAPMILALFAVGLLFVAARGPGRLVKVEEERKAFHERRTFRL